MKEPEPPLDLLQAKRMMDALYQPGDRFYCLAYHDRNPAGVVAHSRLTYGADFLLARHFVEAANECSLATATSVAVFEPEQPGRPAQRTEEQCQALSAFAIDIDPEDLDVLVPGATGVDQVVPEVVRRLEKVAREK